MSQWIYISDTSLLWTPSQLGSSVMKVWLDANDICTITKDSNDYVSHWNDKSENDNHAEQNTESYQPYFDETVKGVYFNGDYLRIPDHYPVSAIFAVINADNTGGYRHILRKGFAAGTSLEYGLRITEGSLTGWYTNPDGVNGLANKSGIASSQKVLCASSRDETTVVVNYNASISPVEISCQDGLFNSSWGTRIGAGWNSENEFGAPYQGYVGYIHELLLLSSVQDTNIKQKIEGYLAHKWSFTDNLPSDHPYKSSPPTA